MRTIADFSKPRNSFWLLLMLFVISRVFYHFVLDIDFVYRLDYWQIPDLKWLMAAPWKTLYDMHMQPPLFSALIYVGEQFFGENAPLFQHGLFMAMGFLVCWGLFHLIKRMYSLPLALGMSIFFMLDPNNLLYESLFFYTYPTMFFLFGLGFFLIYPNQNKGKYLLLAALSAVLLLYTRSLFHLVFLVIPLGYLLLKYRSWKPAAYLLIPLVLVGMLYGKNKAEYGKFGASSWLGMSLSRLMVDFEDTTRLAQIDVPQSIKTNRAFEPVGKYHDLHFEKAPFSHPFLTEEFTSQGVYNLNHQKVLLLDDAYKKLSIAYFKMNPLYYCKQVTLSNLTYLQSPSQYFFYKFEQAGAIIFKHNPKRWEVFVFLADILSFIFTLTLLGWMAYRLFEMMRKGTLRQELPILLVIMFIGYVIVVGNLLEIGENMRFKYLTYPWYYVMMADLLFHWFKRGNVSLNAVKKPAVNTTTPVRPMIDSGDEPEVIQPILQRLNFSKWK